MSKNTFEYPWYVAGLHFQCIECGMCCSGPEEGHIWATDEEIEMIAKKLEMTTEDFRKQYARRIGKRTTLIEDKSTKDCIFLCERDGAKGCSVYEVRPNQCRTWPFWDMNLESPDTWNWAAMKCPGMNQGKFFTYDEIEKLRTQKKWW